MCENWNSLVARYFAAKSAEDTYDREFCWVDPDLPPGPARNAAVDAIPAERWDESERLQDIRCRLEDDLLARPSPTAAAFALKVMICRGDGRDLNGLDDMLENEARQIIIASTFASFTASPPTSETV